MCRVQRRLVSGYPPEIRARAQTECQEFIETCTAERRSFAVETTLRSDIAIQQAKRAKAAGFHVEMVFIATNDAAENVRRVARRAYDDGHSAPEARLREIYEKSLANLPSAIAVFDHVYLFDSSEFDTTPVLVARFVGGKLAFLDAAPPRWCAGLLRQLRKP